MRLRRSLRFHSNRKACCSVQRKSRTRHHPESLRGSPSSPEEGDITRIATGSAGVGRQLPTVLPKPRHIRTVIPTLLNLDLNDDDDGETLRACSIYSPPLRRPTGANRAAVSLFSKSTRTTEQHREPAMLRSSLSGAFRAPVLGRQPTATATGAPLRRLVAQGCRTTPTSTASAPLRGAKGQATAMGARTFGTGRTTFLRSPSAAAPRAQKTAQGLLQKTQKRTFNWTWSRRSGGGGKGAEAEADPQSLSARLRKLSREYGWAALGVYLGLSVLDFPFCFLLVRMVGTDRIAEAERWVMSGLRRIVPESVKERWNEYRAAFKEAEKKELGDNHVSEDVEKVGWGVEKAQERHKEEASLATQLALAYAIHKTFIFIRVPLTAAVTPKVVKVLRGWGYQIGKRKPKTR
ncbi:hypothetical protein diail_5762 [Diaporthe ilicicola]|nr:hypothetical protein diail_5762 [Diaporthe ilicicola]